MNWSGCAVGGHEVDGGAIAVGVVSRFAGDRDAQVVAAEDPDDVVVQSGVDGLGRAGGHRPGGQRAERPGSSRGSSQVPAVA
jgi:hypothetical protein